MYQGFLLSEKHKKMVHIYLVKGKHSGHSVAKGDKQW